MTVKRNHRSIRSRTASTALGLGLVTVCAVAQDVDETEERIRIAASNMEDAIVVDCQLPGRLRRLGGSRNYLTPGRLIRTSAIVCRTRGGEYTLGDLASGTLSLQRWMIPAEQGDAEAQYYVARIYANGMDNVDVNYAEAARWYQMAAEQGYAEAKQELGYLYERGLGVEKDELLALNLQREASGLGDDLDYAYKVADAEARADQLATQLMSANGALLDTQLALRATQDQLSAANESVQQYEVDMVNLQTELAVARRATGADQSARVRELESEIERLSAQLGQSQAAIVALERDRETASMALSTQLANGQATQHELRELMSRTEAAEGEAASLDAALADAQQRLIRSDEELRQLQAMYRNQSEQVAAERARLMAASSQAEDDAAAFVAASEAELASRQARINSLESEVARLQAEERTAAVAEDARAQDAVAQMQRRYEAEIATLRAESEQLKEEIAASADDRSKYYARSRERLAARDTALAATRRQIETLNAETTSLRARVEQLETERLADARQSDLQNAQLQAQLSLARTQVSALRNQLDIARSDKEVANATLMSRTADLEQRMAAAQSESDASLQLLQAEVAEAESTINLQNLRIQALEQQIADSSVQMATLKDQVVEEAPEVVSTEVRNAMEVLDMARSPDEPSLGTYHALLIANQDYETLDDLSTPIRDANEIEKLLQGRYNFTVKKLVNATDDEIMRTLHDYANELTDADNLLIYYAGRGSTPDGQPDRAYWLGVDADPELRNTWLLAEHVSDKIREIQARRILLVTDSCFSRRRIQAKTMSVGLGLDANKFRLLSGFKSRYVLTSGANVPYYDENGDRTHSMFAKVFMEVLRQNSYVLSGEMLSFELSQRLRERVANPDRATPAYSSLQNAGHEAGDFFFVPNPEPVLAASTPVGQDTA